MIVIDELRKSVESLRIAEHYECSEDCWYSCPASPSYCRDDDDKACNCGMDVQNAKLDKILALVSKLAKDK